MEKEKIMSVDEVAGVLHRGTDLIKRGIRQGKFPFGIYIAPEKPDQKHAYIITQKRFEAWIEGKL